MTNYRVSTNTNNSNEAKQDKTTTKSKSAKAFQTKTRLTKIPIDLQTALAADTHLAEGQWLTEQLIVVKLRMFPVGTRRPTVSRTRGQYLVPQKALIKNSASM
jgi:hypothetical protein